MVISVGSQMTMVTASYELAASIYNNSEQKRVLWAMVPRGKPARVPVYGVKTYWSYNILSTDCCSIWVHDPAASATGPDPRNDMFEAKKILH